MAGMICSSPSALLNVKAHTTSSSLRCAAPLELGGDDDLLYCKRDPQLSATIASSIVVLFLP